MSDTTAGVITFINPGTTRFIYHTNMILRNDGIDGYLILQLQHKKENACYYTNDMNACNEPIRFINLYCLVNAAHKKQGNY